MKNIGWKIKNLRTDLGLTQAELGARVGEGDQAVPQATIAKWENDKQRPRHAALSKLAELAGETSLQFSGMEVVPASHLPGRVIEVVTSVQAGSFRASAEWEPSRRYEVPVTLPRMWDNVPIHAAEVDGESMNQVYPNGSIVFIAPLEHVPGGLKSGMHVMVVKHEHGEYEVTLKEYVVDEYGKKWLRPRSTDLAHQSAVQFNRNADLEVRGVVVSATVLAPGFRR